MAYQLEDTPSGSIETSKITSIVRIMDYLSIDIYKYSISGMKKKQKG